MKWLILAVIIAGLAGGGIWYWQSKTEKDPKYKMAPITVGDLIQTVTATGQLNPVTNVQVGSQVSGIISKLYTDWNCLVTNGQLVAQLDPATYQAIAAQAEGDLANAKAGLELAKAEEERSAELIKSKIVAQSDYDSAVATFHQAQAQVAIKEAALKLARVNLAYTSIYAPIDGVVISRNVDVGQTVAASLSAPILFQIANDLRKMQIDALVSEADVGGIETNQAVNFSVDAFPSRPFHGVVIQVRDAPQTNQNVITYDTVIAVDNLDLKLRPGMTANVSIITAQRTNVLRIPNGALRFRPAEVIEADRANIIAANNGAQRQGGGAGGGQRGDAASPGGQRRSGGSGGANGGGGTGGNGSGRPRGGGAKTVYLAVKTPEGKEKAEATQIHTGIGDGVFTEVTDGLKEGDQIIVSQNLPAGTAAPAASANPFGGGGRRGF